MTIKEIFNSIDKKEWHFVIIVIVVMLLLNFLPFLYGFLNAPAGHFYRGIHAFLPEDYPVYFSYIQQVKDGNVLLFDNFTSEVQPSGVFNIFWLAVGLFAKFFNLSNILAFQLARFLLIPVFLTIAYLFISYFFKNKNQRKLGYLLMCFSSGLGAVYLFFTFWFTGTGLWPIDLWITGISAFLSLYNSPHYILSLIFLLLFILFFLLAAENLKFFYSVIAGLIGFIWFNFHPYFFVNLFIIFFVYTLFSILKNKNINYLWHFLSVFLLSLPFVIYHFYLIRTDFVIGLRAGQNITKLPPFQYIFLGYGFLFVSSAGILLCWIIKKQIKNNSRMFLLIWFAVSLSLIYSPVNFTSKFIFGWQVIMSILTVYFLYLLRNLFLNSNNKFVLYLIKNKALVFLGILVLFCISPFFNLARDIVYYRQQDEFFYLANEYQPAFAWLAENNQAGKIILANEFNGNIIPGYINQKVFLGHSQETINYSDKKALVNAYLNNNLSFSDEISFLGNNNIGYLFINKKDLEVLRTKPYLEEVFNQGDIIIYKVFDI